MWIILLIFSLTLPVFAGGRQEDDPVVPAEEKTEEAPEEKAMPEKTSKYGESPMLAASVCLLVSTKALRFRYRRAGQWKRFRRFDAG